MSIHTMMRRLGLLALLLVAIAALNSVIVRCEASTQRALVAAARAGGSDD
jgi:hypothetical protein